MSAPGTIAIVWSNGENEFCLAKIGLMIALEEKCGVPIAHIFDRLLVGKWGVQDVRETIRLGLMGGGMTPNDALTAVKTHVDENPNGLAPSVLVAIEILKAVMVGVPRDPVGKKDDDQGKAPPAEAGTGSTTTTDGSSDLS
jgi:Phage tail tube protein, GTA-gp10